jgi:hypothetical protein
MGNFYPITPSSGKTSAVLCLNRYFQHFFTFNKKNIFFLVYLHIYCYLCNEVKKKIKKSMSTNKHTMSIIICSKWADERDFSMLKSLSDIIVK